MTQNGVLSMLILLFETKRSRKVRDQVSKEAASRTAFNCASRCCSVKFLGTILVQIFLILISSISIKRTVPRLMFTSPAINLSVNLRSDRKSFLIRVVLSSLRVADGHPLCYSSSKRVLSSENILCQRKTCALDVVSSPKAC